MRIIVTSFLFLCCLISLRLHLTNKNTLLLFLDIYIGKKSCSYISFTLIEIIKIRHDIQHQQIIKKVLFVFVSFCEYQHSKYIGFFTYTHGLLMLRPMIIFCFFFFKLHVANTSGLSHR